MLNLSLNYQEISKALELFIRQEVTGPGFKKAVLGLSGGIDSALVAGLAARALGPENVTGIRMPYSTSSADSLSDAEKVAGKFGIRMETIPVSDACDGFFATVPDMDHRRKGNVMARLRMVTLFDYSLKTSSLVLGTSNKTELMLGYGTWYGDLASAVNPIGDLYKTQIWELSEFVGVPREVILKKPSADLWAGQTDEQEMGFSYPDADQILYHLVDLRKSDQEISDLGFPVELVRKIRKMVIGSQYKRRMPVIAKLTTRAVGTDFLYPRDWFQKV